MQHAKKSLGVFQRLHGREFAPADVSLTPVHRIIERYGGPIRAAAAVARRAIFTFLLPADGDRE